MKSQVSSNHENLNSRIKVLSQWVKEIYFVVFNGWKHLLNTSPRNEKNEFTGLNQILEFILYIYIYIYIYLNKNWNIFLVRTKFYWSWATGLVLIVRTGTPSVHLNDVFYLLIGWYVCFTTDGQLCIQLVCVYHGCRRECFSWLDLWYVIYLKSRWEWLYGFFPGNLVSSTNKTDCHNYSWNIVESGVIHHKETK